MIPVVLALCASLGWGCSDFIAGLQARARPILTVLLATQLTGLVAMGIVVLARGDGPPGGAAVLFPCLSGVAGVLGFGFFYRALATGRMSIVAPLIATSAIVPVLLGFARGERPSALQLAGMVAAGVGVLVVVRAEGDEEDADGSARKAVLLALAGALVFGFALAGLAVGSDDDPYWTVLFYRVVAAATTIAVVAAVRHRPHVPLVAAPALLAVGVLDTTSTALFAVAANKGLLSVVSVLASLYPVVTIALAHAHLGERLRPVQLTAVAIVLAGIAALSAG